VQTDSQGRFYISGLLPGTKVHFPDHNGKKNDFYHMDPILLDEPGSVYRTVITRLYEQ